MPEYRAPDIYVEETGFHSRPIEGVSTSTAGFVGPTLFGPTDSAPEVITSVTAFEQHYGGLDDLPYGPNYLAHAVRTYFENGGMRLYVARTESENGLAPGRAAYEAALTQLHALDEISTLAAPGYSSYPEYTGIQQVLISYAETRGAYRLVVLDVAPGLTLDGARDARSNINSSHAALYYPWVVVSNPLQTQAGRQSKEIILPPSGFICGIYARNDIERGVHRAPANEIVCGALRFECDIDKDQLELLNPIGINCLRHLPGHGNRVWGAWN